MGRATRVIDALGITTYYRYIGRDELIGVNEECGQNPRPKKALDLYVVI